MICSLLESKSSTILGSYPAPIKSFSQSSQVCTSFGTNTIPATITTIGENAFYDCTSLTDVYFAGTPSQWSEMTIDSGNELLAKATIHYGAEDVVEPEVPEVPEEPEVKPDENGLILPIEYNGVSIHADEHGYYYVKNDVYIYCQFYGAKDEAGSTLKDESGAVIIDFWYDGRIDHFIPLVVEVKK
jgi:hypothetical protein